MWKAKLSMIVCRPLILTVVALTAPAAGLAEPGSGGPSESELGRKISQQIQSSPLGKEILPNVAESSTPSLTPDGLDKGEKVRAEVERWQDRVRRKIEALDKNFAELDLRKVEVQKLSRERFEEILDDLEEESELILRAFADVKPDVKLLRQTLEKAPSVFREIAKEFEAEAEKSEDGFFRESYADLAAASQKMATTCEQKAKGIDGLERELEAKLKFVQSSQGFCQHIRRFLRTIPTEEGIATEKWIERVNQYVAALEQSVKLLKTMTQGMEGKPSNAPKPTTKPAPTRAEATPERTPLHASSPPSLTEAKARLAALKR